MATITSVQSGNWSEGTTWDSGSMPGLDYVVIASGHVVTFDAATRTIKQWFWWACLKFLELSL